MSLYCNPILINKDAMESTREKTAGSRSNGSDLPNGMQHRLRSDATSFPQSDRMWHFVAGRHLLAAISGSKDK